MNRSRWVEWVTATLTGVTLIVVAALVPAVPTMPPPRLSQRRAARFRLTSRRLHFACSPAAS